MITRKTPRGIEYALTEHALYRMIGRGITLEEIEEVLDGNCITDETDPGGNHRLVSLLRNGRQLRIVVDKRTNPFEVITAIVLG